MRYELDEWVPRGTKIGWISADNNDVFLSAENAYAAAQELARKQNANIPVSKETLIKYLKERHLLASIDTGTGRATPRKRMAGKVTRVLHLFARTLFPKVPKMRGPRTTAPATEAVLTVKAIRIPAAMSTLPLSPVEAGPRPRAVRPPPIVPQRGHRGQDGPWRPVTTGPAL